MKCGWRIKSIESITLKHYYAFGKQGFFRNDIETIVNWCNMLRILDYKIRHNENLYLSLSTGIESEHEIYAEEAREKWELFKQLVSLTSKLRSKFTINEANKKKKPDCLDF